jgi:hypothetical protein
MPEWATWVILALIVAFGLIVGLFASMWAKLGLFLVGGWIGATGGSIIYNTLLASAFGTKSKNPYIVVVIICVIIGGILAVKLFNHAVAVGSALCGAYALMRVS